MSDISKRGYLNYFAALVLAIVAIALLLIFSGKYKATIVSHKYIGSNLSFYYHDLDHDGSSERLELHKYEDIKASIIVFQNNQIIDQWNFDGNYKKTLKPIINDFDKDGIDEVFLFIQKQDSLHLYCIDAISKDIEFSTPVCKLYSVNEKYQFSVEGSGFIDVTQDGVNEFFFSVKTGFSTRPRNMFAYYPAENKVYMSAESCASTYNPVMFDMDGDSIPEFVGCNKAFGNCNFDREFSDMYSWLMVFTPKMQFKFPPVSLGKYPASTEITPYLGNEDKYILVLQNNKGTEGAADFISLFNNKGESLLSREIKKEENCEEVLLFSSDSSFNSIYLVKSSGEIHIVNKNLEFEKKADIGEIYLLHPQRVDVEGDDELEYVFVKKDRLSLIITRSDFSNPVYLKLPGIIGLQNISVIENIDSRNLVSVQSDNHIYNISYERSFIHKYWYLLIILLLLPIILILFVAKYISEFREIKRLNSQKELAELQMKSIQNQIDPHFTFNLLQSFGSLINENDKKKAEYLFNKYASMLKTNVINSDKVFLPLQEELDFITSYMDLEKFRQEDKFEYTVNISSEIDTSLQIPKMLLHTFIENAIKHGLRHLKSSGKLEISAIQQNETIEISIIDNGVGREKAAEHSRFSTGQGLRIMDQILELYFLLFKIRIEYEIIDIVNEGEARGTRVNIKLPLE